jgi:hypothetical protein
MIRGVFVFTVGLRALLALKLYLTDSEDERSRKQQSIAGTSAKENIREDLAYGGLHRV